MGGLLKSYAKTLEEVMMVDQMDIERIIEVENPDGTTTNKYAPYLQNQRCRISFTYMENPQNIVIDRNPLQFPPKLFCKYNQDIKDGDKVYIRRLDVDGNIINDYQGIVGKIVPYPTHKEMQFAVNENA